MAEPVPLSSKWMKGDWEKESEYITVFSSPPIPWLIPPKSFNTVNSKLTSKKCLCVKPKKEKWFGEISEVAAPHQLCSYERSRWQRQLLLKTSFSPRKEKSCKRKKGEKVTHRSFLDTDAAQLLETFSSFISCNSLCIKLGFPSDAVHTLENYPKCPDSGGAAPQSVEQHLGKRCETKEVEGKKWLSIRQKEAVVVGGGWVGEKKVIKKETNGGGGFWSVGFNANSSEQTCELLLLLCLAPKQPLLWCFSISLAGEEGRTELCHS